MAGLSAATELADQGWSVTLYDGAPQAGGRCRSYHDKALDCVIDNGNHLLFSGNWAARGYLQRIGAGDSLVGPDPPAIPFVDLDTDERWAIEPSPGVIQWWAFDPKRRVPGSRLADYLSMLRLMFSRAGGTMADHIRPDHPLYRRFWEPVTVAVMNIAASEAAAAPMQRVMWETFGRGGAHCRPLVARDSLATSFVDPALAWLAGKGATVRLNTRIRRLDAGVDRVRALDLGGERVAIDAGDAIVIATPPTVAAALVPGLTVPRGTEPILNAHFRLPAPISNRPIDIIGLVGSHAQWVFVRGAIASVTVSAAGGLIDEEVETLGPKLWAEVARAIRADPATVPPVRIVKEKRATFRQTPAEIRRRPGAITRWPNCVLAGDWTDTGLPATIEGSIRSGLVAARRVIRRG